MHVLFIYLILILQISKVHYFIPTLVFRADNEPNQFDINLRLKSIINLLTLVHAPNKMNLS